MFIVSVISPLYVSCVLYVVRIIIVFLMGFMCSLYLVLNIILVCLCISLGSLGISRDKRHLCFIYLFMNEVLISFVLCSVFVKLFLFLCLEIIL
jgi:hypothetical protein